MFHTLKKLLGLHRMEPPERNEAERLAAIQAESVAWLLDHRRSKAVLVRAGRDIKFGVVYDLWPERADAPFVHPCG